MMDPTVLPDDLPVPEDDGAADHLRGAELPAIAMPSKTTAQARMPVIASTAWRDLDVGTATPFATQQPQ